MPFTGLLVQLFKPCTSDSKARDFEEKAPSRGDLNNGRLVEEKGDAPVLMVRSDRPTSSRSHDPDQNTTVRQVSGDQSSPRSTGRDRSYSRSSVISQVRITVETATESVASPLSSPHLTEKKTLESYGGDSEHKRVSATTSEQSRRSRDSGYQDHAERDGEETLNAELPKILEEVQSPKQQLFRPLSLTGLPKLQSSPPELGHNLLAVRPLYPRRAHSSSDASIRSMTSTLSVPSSLAVRKRLVSHVSSGTGLELRLSGETDPDRGTPETRHLVDLVRQNKLERVPDRQAVHDANDDLAVAAQEVD